MDTKELDLRFKVAMEQHDQTIMKIIKKYKVTNRQAVWCLNKACDFNFSNEQELWEVLSVITYTLKSLAEEYDLKKLENDVSTCCVCGKKCIPQSDCPDVMICPDKDCSIHKEG